MTMSVARISLFMAAMAASGVMAQAQTSDPHHPANPANGMAPPSTMPMPMTDAGAKGGMTHKMHRMTSESSGMGMSAEHVESRIDHMKSALKLTSSQMPQWAAFADTLRADAAAMTSMHDTMMKGGMPMTTPERMAAHRKMMTERMAMMDRSDASTSALYAVLSDDQRKVFDKLMAGEMGMM
jgi:hypothetical protein